MRGLAVVRAHGFADGLTTKMLERFDGVVESVEASGERAQPEFTHFH